MTHQVPLAEDIAQDLDVKSSRTFNLSVQYNEAENELQEQNSNYDETNAKMKTFLFR